jgi:hypothetical protein
MLLAMPNATAWVSIDSPMAAVRLPVIDGQLHHRHDFMA